MDENGFIGKEDKPHNDGFTESVAEVTILIRNKENKGKFKITFTNV